MAQLALVAGSAKICEVGRVVSVRFDVNTPGSYAEAYMGAAPTLTDGDREITLIPLLPTMDIIGGKLQWDLYFEVPIDEPHIEVGHAATWTLDWGTALASDGTNATPTTGSIEVSNTSLMDSSWEKSSTGTPAAQYYVRPTGNDSNNGSNGAPWRTLSKARQVCNASHNGQHVIVHVDGGSYGSLDNFTTIAGLAVRSPIHFKATGTGGQPVITVAGDGGVSWGTNASVSNFTFEGFRIECGGGASGLSLLGSSLGGVWFIRCSIQAKGAAMFGNLASRQYSVASSVDHTGLAQRGARFFKCFMGDGLGHHGQGDYAYRAPGSRFIACVIDHAGFEVLAGGTIRRSTYGHTQYEHGGNEGLQCYMCTFTRSGCNGFSSNSKGAVFLRCMGFSNPCSLHLRGMGHNGAGLCVFEDGQDTNNGADPAPYGIGCQINVKWPNNDPVNDPNITDGPATLRLCAFINKSTGVGGSPAIEMLGQIAGSRPLMLDGCIIKDWGTGKAIVRTDSYPNPEPNRRTRPDQEPLMDMVHVRNCSIDMRAASGERTCVEFQTTFIPTTRMRFSGTNRYHTNGAAKFRLDGVPISEATWLTLDPGAVFTAPVYPDATRSFPRYCTEVLGLADVSAFYAAIRTMSVLAFDVRYCQAAYWVLAGLTDLVEDPIDSGGPTLTPELAFVDLNGAAWTSGDVAYTQNAIKFGENQAESIRINNVGTGTLHNVSVTLGGSLTSGVAFPDELEIAPGAGIDVSFSLLCQSAGAKSGTITIASDELDDVVMTITWTVPSGVPSGQGPLGSIKGWLITGVRSVTAKLWIWR